MCLSVLILYYLYKGTSFSEVSGQIKLLNPYFFSGFVILILVQLIIAVCRWKYITGKLAEYKINFSESAQLVIGSYSANLIIPAKMGEFIRVIWEKNKEKRKQILKLVFFEKILDVFSLYLIYALTLTFVLNTDTRVKLYLISVVIPVISSLLFLLLLKNRKITMLLPKKVSEFISLLKTLFSEKRKFFYRIIFISLLLWIIQVGQFIFIFLSANVSPGLVEAYAGNSLAILAGAFIPSIGGIGPRDATIIWFFDGLASDMLLTTIGLISALRIIIPALIGLPFFFNLTRK